MCSDAGLDPTDGGCHECPSETPERCDGADTDRDGSIDEGACEPSGACSNYRTDPVHVGNGSLFTHPVRDVDLLGSPMPLYFERRYTSLDGWADYRDPHGTRLSPGWFHTFDQRLYGEHGRSQVALVPSAEPLRLVHRQESGAGRAFECAPPHDPAIAFSCASSDGSLDVLHWEPTTGRWRLDDASARHFDYFLVSGRWVERRNAEKRASSSQGFGWTLNYDTAGLLSSVSDDFGRTLVFLRDDSDYSDGMGPKISGVAVGRIGGSPVAVARFEYLSGGYLGRVSYVGSGTTIESWEYDYHEMSNGSSVPWITEIRHGDAVMLSAEIDEASVVEHLGRVRHITASDGEYTLRYPDEAPAVCAVPSASSLILDHSVDPGPSCASATGDPDVWCTSQMGELAGCDDANVCRPATCQQWLGVGSGLDLHHSVAIAGNCPCGNAEQTVWTSPTSGPRRVAHTTHRDGTRTTYAYDTQARLVAICENDDDTSVTTSVTSCPTSGRHRRYTYDPNWPGIVASVVEASSLQPNATRTTSYAIDATTGRVIGMTETGWSYGTVPGNPNGTQLASQTRTTTFTYDTTGRLTHVSEPGGRLTVRAYHGLGVGFISGLLASTTRDTFDHDLVTTYGSYNLLGRVTAMTHENGAAEARTYDARGARVAAIYRASEVTTFQYDSGGRLAREGRPDGMYVRYAYDGLGRLLRADELDFAASATDTTSWRTRTSWEYDAAGRRTRERRQIGSGTTWTTLEDTSFGYDQRGQFEGQQPGPQLAMFLQRDPMGRVEAMMFGDGNWLDLSYDALGRELTRSRDPGTSSNDVTYASVYDDPATGITRLDDRPTRITDAGGIVHDYQYDDFGRLVEAVSPDFGQHRWTYASNYVTHYRPGGRRSLAFLDEVGRVSMIAYDFQDSGIRQDYTFRYGDDFVACNISGSTCPYRKGELARVDVELPANATWTFEYDYDQHGRVTTEHSGVQTTRYEYLPGGRRRRMFFPGGSEIQRWDYDTTNGNEYRTDEPRNVASEISGLSSTYRSWATDLRRNATGQRGTLVAGGLDLQRTFRTDGKPLLWRVAPLPSGPAHFARTYTYANDGMTTGWTSAVANDSSRRVTYDAADRFACAYTGTGTSCPSAGNVLLYERVEWDGAGNHVGRGTNVGATTYALVGNTLYDEYLANGQTIWYEYDAAGQRLYDQNVGTGVPQNQRSYTYDGAGRVRTVRLSRYVVGSSTPQTRDVSFFYDHRSRPFLITDVNVSTGAQAHRELYWDQDDRLITRITRPNAAAPTQQILEHFFHVIDGVIGVIRLDYTSGSLVERHYLDLLDPVGLPIVRMEVPVPNGSTATLVARPQWTAFGELRNTVSAELPPWGFHGQVVATETTANAPNGSLLQTLRSPLSLNTWRVYDPRVGQYLTPEPMATEGATRWSTFGYALEAPYDLWDPDGRFISSCTATPSAAIACGAGIGGGGFLGTSALGGGAAAGGAAGATGGAVAGGIAAPTAGQAIAGAICVAAAATTTHVLPDATTGDPSSDDGDVAGCYLESSSNLSNDGGGYRGGPTTMMCKYRCRGFGTMGASHVTYNCPETQASTCSVQFAASKTDLQATLLARGCYHVPWRPPFWPGR